MNVAGEIMCTAYSVCVCDPQEKRRTKRTSLNHFGAILIHPTTNNQYARKFISHY